MASLNNCRITLSLLKIRQLGLLSSGLQPAASMDQVRHHKHYNPLFKKHRAMKVRKINLPDFGKKESDYTEEETRSKMKREGVVPPRAWSERPFYISCTGGIFEAYVPPEGDGKKSIITTPGVKQQAEMMQKKGKLILAVRKIRSFDDDFESKEFPAKALDIYIQAHTYLVERNKAKLREVVTEKCYPMLRHQVGNKTLRWKFIKSIEPPKIVHAVYTSLITKDNFYAQITVRFHTQQQLAIYDRFGRLMHGSEIIAKDVLEYAVFEKHLSNLYGVWRLHDKIVPDWTPEREPSRQTFCRPDKPIDVGISTEKEQTKEVLERVAIAPESSTERPLATA